LCLWLYGLRNVLGGLQYVPHPAKTASNVSDANSGAHGTFRRLPSTFRRLHNSTLANLLSMRFRIASSISVSSASVSSTSTGNSSRSKTSIAPGLAPARALLMDVVVNALALIPAAPVPPVPVGDIYPRSIRITPRARRAVVTYRRSIYAVACRDDGWTSAN
jgi:hypothetical protein